VGDFLVSVVTPTSKARHAFHPLLYECFRTQTYEPKELVVVDTGDEPSQFLQARAREDARVKYRWWPVDDARVQELADALVDLGGEGGSGGYNKPDGALGSSIADGIWPGGRSPLAAARREQEKREQAESDAAAEKLRRKLQGRVRGGVRKEGWSLGLKRNLACHIAQGQAIAHFDDDDLYAPGYLSVMCANLKLAAKPRLAEGGDATTLKPAAATLEAWHVLDLAELTFGYFNPQMETLLDATMRRSYAYGFGFSYIYSRAAWVQNPFADVEWSEDGEFTGSLMDQGHEVRLVNPKSVKEYDSICAHTHHRETTSGGEFTDLIVTEKSGVEVTKSVRLGKKVPTPKSLQMLVPLIQAAAACINVKKNDVHPMRQEMTNHSTSLGREVGLQDKLTFLQGHGVEPIGKTDGYAPGPGFNSERHSQFRQLLGGKGKGKGLRGRWGQPAVGSLGRTGGRQSPVDIVHKVEDLEAEVIPD